MTPVEDAKRVAGPTASRVVKAWETRLCLRGAYEMYLRTTSQEYSTVLYGGLREGRPVWHESCNDNLLVRVTICYCRDIIQIIAIPNAR